MNRSFAQFAGITAVFLAFAATGDAQNYVPRAQPVSQMMQPGLLQGGQPQERMSMVNPDKKLSAGDQVTVRIVEDGDGGVPRVVTATGELDVPPIGRVRVSGKSTAQAESVIKQLLEREYYYKATVVLSIDQVASVQVQQGSITLSGQVRMVGMQPLVAGESLTVTGAILKAGGPTEWARVETIKVTRPKKDGSVERFEVNYKKIIETGDVNSDPVVQDGDRIEVPKARVRF